MEVVNSIKDIFQIKSALRALKYRNFRLFFSGQSISLIGTWMQRIAMSWLVYRLTSSAFLLGVVGFAGMVPTGFIAPIAGVLADRFDKLKIILITQILAGIQGILLAVLVLTNLIQIWHIIVLSIVLGVINAFDMPTRQSFTVQMVDDKKDLGNAIALNSTMVNGARLLGPTIGGLLIAVFGEGMCFMINGLSYLPVIVSLLLMRIQPLPVVSRKTKILRNLKDGFKYAKAFEPIRAILLMYALVSLVASPYGVLMPIFAKDILKGGPDTLGFLMGTGGIGALFGALYLAFKKSVLGLTKMIPISAGIFALGLICFSFSKVLTISLIFMFIVGWGQMVGMATTNTLLQTLVDDDKRGRVMSFYTMAFMGAMPIGNLIAGFVASRIGAPWTLFSGGAACLIGVVLFFRKLPRIRELIRPVYISLGILPEKNSDSLD